MSQYQLDFDEKDSYTDAKPVVQIKFSADLKEWQLEDAILDTGAPVCVFSQDHGLAIGLDLQRPPIE